MADMLDVREAMRRSARWNASRIAIIAGDQREALAAFRDSRPPTFSGK
jgi:hypothetical protein